MEEATMEDLETTPAFDGRYAAFQDDDGTWTIQDVEFFGPLPAGARRNMEDIGTGWMDTALERHRMRFEEEGYLPPLHVKHHKLGQETKPAGYFIPTRRGVTRLNGEDVPVMFADLIKIPAEVFSEIENHRMPYRSPEVTSWEKPEFASLALLQDEAPFFKFPLLVPAKGPKPSGNPTRISSDELAVAFCGRDSEGGRILFSFADTQPVIEEEADEMSSSVSRDERKERAHEARKLRELRREKNLGYGMSGKKAAKARRLTTLDRNEAQGRMADTFEEDSPMMQILQAIAQKLGVTTETDQVSETELGLGTPPAEQEMEKRKMSDHETHALDDVGGEQLGAHEGELLGRIAALEASQRRRDAEDQSAGLVSAAMDALSEYEVDDKTYETIHLMADAGEDVLVSFVESYMRATPVDPPTTFADYQSGAHQDPEAVMQFSAGGPEALEAARAHYGNWKLLNDKGLTSVDPESFINTQMEVAARNAERATQEA